MRKARHIPRKVRPTARWGILFLFFFNPGWISAIHAQQGWERMTDMPTSRSVIETVEQNGKIYVIGGDSSRYTQYLSCNEVYDIETDSWSVMAKMGTPRVGHSVEIVNDKIYVVGGVESVKQNFSDILEYDIKTDTWATKCLLPEPRFNHISEVIDGKIYLSAGFTVDEKGSHPGLWSTLVYDPQTNQLDTVADLNIDRHLARSCLFDNKIYVFGGASTDGYYEIARTSIEIYDPKADEWTLSEDEIPVPFMYGIVLVHGDSIFLFGGSKRVLSEGFYHSVYKYVPGARGNKWEVMASMPVDRYRMSGNLVNNYLHMFGGVAGGMVGPDFSTADIKVAPDNHWRLNLDSLKSWDGPCSEARISDAEPLLLIDSTQFITLQIIPSNLPVYQVSWSSSNSDVATVSSEGMVTAVSAGEATITGTAVSGGCSVIHGVSVLDHIPEVFVQVIDENTVERLSGCQVFLNGKRFEKDSEDALNLTGWAYDSCNIQITREDYDDLDTTVVINSDTTLVMGLQHLYHPELHIYSEPVLEKRDLLKMMMTQHGWIYVTPEGTSAVSDSITKYAVKSKNVSAGTTDAIPLFDLPPGTYRIYGISLGGRVATESYVVQVIDHFPECIIQVLDSVSGELLNSCLLVLDGNDTIPGNLGEFDLSGLVYDTCFIEVTREGYHDFHTTLVALADTSYAVFLIPMIIESVTETFIQEINIYPNPTQDHITVQIREQGIYSLEIINLSGQVENKLDIADSVTQVDFSPLPTGIYIIRIISTEKVFVGRVVKY